MNAKPTHELTFDLPTDTGAGVSLQSQLYEALRGAILDARLKPGARLPASRALAASHKIARNTVLAAYDQLIAEGYLEARLGAGTFVSASLPESFMAADPHPAALTPTVEGGRETKPLVIHTGLPAIDAFPLDIWARISGSTARRLKVTDLGQGDPQGYPPLRRAVADYLAASRNVHVSPDCIVIVSGLQQGLKLVADSVLSPSASIILEDPGYDGLLTTARHCRQPHSFTEVDASGARPPTSNKPGDLLIISPSHQYPLGITMPVARRMELLDWASRTGGLIFEDDYDSEFRYSSKPISSLHGLSKSDNVIYGGSFSKATFPALRLGYLVLPKEFVAPVVTRRAATDSFPSLIPQRTLAEFISGGHFGRHLRRMRKIHEERQAAYIAAFEENLSAYFTLAPAGAGLDLVAYPTDKLHGSKMAAEAAWVDAVRRAGLSALALSGRYRERKAKEGMLLGFACFDEKTIKSNISKLARYMLEQTGF